MTNLQRFNYLEKRVDEEVNNLREIAKVEDNLKMFQRMEDKMATINRIKKEMEYMSSECYGQWQEEYQMDPLEELLGTDKF